MSIVHSAMRPVLFQAQPYPREVGYAVAERHPQQHPEHHALSAAVNAPVRRDGAYVPRTRQQVEYAVIHYEIQQSAGERPKRRQPAFREKQQQYERDHENRIENDIRQSERPLRDNIHRILPSVYFHIRL